MIYSSYPPREVGIITHLFSHTGGNQRTDWVNKCVKVTWVGNEGTWTPIQALWLKNWSFHRSASRWNHGHGLQEGNVPAQMRGQHWSHPTGLFPPFYTDQWRTYVVKQLSFEKKKMLPKIFSLGLLKVLHLIIERIQLRMDWTVFMDISSKFNQHGSQGNR